MKSISTKLWLIIIGFTALILTLTLIIGFSLFNKYYYHTITSNMITEAKGISDIYYQAENEEEFKKEVDRLRNVLKEEIIVTSNSMLLAGCIPFEQASKDMLISAEERGQLVEGKTVVHKGYHSRFGKQILAVVVPLFRDDRMVGAVFLYSSLALLQEDIDEIQNLILFGGIIAIAAAICIGFFLSKKLSSPLIRMEKVAQQMTKGNYEVSLEERSKDEIGRLSTSLNQLSAALVKQEKLRRDFVANVSHELRTPLSFLQGYSEILLDGVDNPKESEEYLSIILEETKRLRRLVDDLLNLTRLDIEQQIVNRSPIDWAKVVQSVINNFKPIAEEKGIILSYKAADDLRPVCGNVNQLKQVLINLLDNAHRFTSSGGEIEVLLSLKSDHVTTQVRDTGKGIPEEELPMIWERFYKVDKSRAGRSGTGLGLAIVKDIIQDHGGQIKVESEEGKGSIFTFTLQICPDAKCDEYGEYSKCDKCDNCDKVTGGVK